MAQLTQQQIDALLNQVADRTGVTLTGQVTVESGGEEVIANLT